MKYWRPHLHEGEGAKELTMSKEPSDTIALDSIYQCRWVRVPEEL